MRFLKQIFTILCIFPVFNILGQQSFIRGTVFDAKTGEFLPGVTVFLEGTSTGTITDFDGKFNLALQPGTYDIRISYISYETVNMKGVQIKPGEVKVFDELGLKEASITITGVTVTAERVRNTENALMAMKMKSTNLFDGISAVNLRKTGDSDAAASISRVTGVSISQGKYVYVRGLGDRYTKTIMNGVDIPGLDPDRNTIQMDIFPTSIIDNLIVYKTFSADLPADFTGGVVDIALKDFPEKATGNLTINGGYSPNSHFNDNYLTYEGGKTDFLGFDDGTRAIPAVDNIPLFSDVVGRPNSEQGIRYQQILRGFNPTMAAQKEKSLMDFGFSATYGNQKPLSKITLGYNVNLSYKNSTDFYENATYGRFGMNSDHDVTALDQLELQTGSYGVSNAFLSGLAGVALKTKNAKFRLNLLHLQNGESKAGIFTVESTDQGSNYTAIQHNLDYSQRSLSNLLVEGKHVYPESKWTVEWKLSPTISKIEDPDIRMTRYQPRGGSFAISTETGFPERIWRNLEEKSYAGLYHAKKEFTVGDRKTMIQLGNSYTSKERDYIIHNFAINVRNVPLTGDPNELFRPENLWPLNGTNGFSGTTYEASFIPVNPNKYNATIQNIAGYVIGEIEATARIKAIVGVRAENYIHFYTGQNQQGDKVLDNAKVLEKTDFFPSVNLLYTLQEKQNLRFTYAKTIARPSFKELSFSEIYDPISGSTFIGGMHRDENREAGIVYWDGNLKTTNIQNIDLRWEMFFEQGQMASVSAFYKKFENPIELVQYFVQKGSYQPRNVGEGNILGLEAEFRVNLDALSEKLSGFSISSNVTFTKSRIELSQTELESRTENARTGETVDKYRDMAGQAPYIINAGISFDGGKEGLWKGLDAGLFYNVQGPTLQFVGIADRPDIYSKPFHSLNFNSNKKFGKDDRFQSGIKIDNILNNKKEEVFKSFKADDRLAKSINPGMTFRFRFSYSFF